MVRLSPLALALVGCFVACATGTGLRAERGILTRTSETTMEIKVAEPGETCTVHVTRVAEAGCTATETFVTNVDGGIELGTGLDSPFRCGTSLRRCGVDVRCDCGDGGLAVLKLSDECGTAPDAGQP